MKDEVNTGFHPSSFILHPFRDPVVWGLVAVGLALRIGYNLALHSGADPTSSFIIDEREYFGAAHVLAEGRGFSFFDTALWVRPPLYVLMLAAVMRFTGTPYLPVLLLQSLLSAATLLPLGWLAWRIQKAEGRRQKAEGRKPEALESLPPAFCLLPSARSGIGAARWAVALGAFFLPFTLFAGLLLSETLFTFLLALTLVTLVRAREIFELGGLRKSVPWLLGAGLLLGLSALTRATAVGFVPLVAIWFTLSGRPKIQSPKSKVQNRQRLLATAVILGACVVTLVPWTVRNYAAYGKLVPLDTTGGYNLWLASVGVRDEERLQADYRALPNQADRQSYAYARAWENIVADPLKFAGKGLKESLDLWKPQFSAEERQVKGYALGRVPAWHLASLFVLDDLLYVAILGLATFGFALGPPHSLKWLTAGWVLLWVAISFIFFAVTRFRLPVVAALVPWAGVGLHTLSSWLMDNYSPQRRRVHRGSLGFTKYEIRNTKYASRFTLPALVVMLLATLIVTLPEIQPGEIARGMERWGQQEGYRNGESLVRAGDVQGAIGAYDTANPEISDTRYALAAAYLRQGQPQQALSKLRADEPTDRFEHAIIRGEAARQAGDLKAARSFFNAREVNVAGDAALRWAWDHLLPAPTGLVELGSGLDIGYVRGFYGAETDADGVTFRWSGAHAEVRGITDAALEVRVEWSGWRPAGLPSAAPLLLTSEARDAATPPLAASDLPNVLNWLGRAVDVSAPDALPLQLDVNAFIGGGNDPRLLGVRVSKVEMSK